MGELHCCKVMHIPQACSSSGRKNLSQRVWNPRLMARKVTTLVYALRQLLSGTHSGRKKRRMVPVNWRLLYLACPCWISIGFPQMADLQLISYQTGKEWRGGLPAWILYILAFPSRWAHRYNLASLGNTANSKQQHCKEMGSVVSGPRVNHFSIAPSQVF